MKRLAGSDSSHSFMSISHSKEEKHQKKLNVYSKEFQEMLDSLDEEDMNEETERIPEKKRRLRIEQVKALERSFEVENKLEAERKVKIAAELGLEPRQVAIWFQNRRARWKTKQLERDYDILKSNYDSLKLNYENLEQENASLSSMLKQLKGKLYRENQENNESSVEDKNGNFDPSEANVSDQIHGISKDGSSESNSTYNTTLPSNSTMNWFKLSGTVEISGKMYEYDEEQIMRIEEQSLFSTEEGCDFFSVDQAPSLRLYFTE